MPAAFSFNKIYGPTKGDRPGAKTSNTDPPQAPHSSVDISNENVKAEAYRKIISMGSAALYIDL